MRVAVVDDDPIFLDLLAWTFGERGWDTIGFSREQGTFAQLAAAQPDLIILDLHIGPGRSGWDILALLEGDPRTFQIPVIICSAASKEMRDRQEWLEQRGIYALPKPFEIDDLLRLADAALGGPKQVRPRPQSA
jgi:DNA-binding response OmpR family regulator